MKNEQQDNPVIVVFTENDSDRERLRSMMTLYFGAYLKVVPMSIADVAGLTEPPRVVVVNITSQKVAPRCFPESAIVYARRLVDSVHLERLVEIPSGEKALVVNKPREIATETRNDLLALGVRHLDLHPYWPGFDGDITDIGTVIYAGYRQYCPEIPGARYIDIGYRSLSPSTLAEIIKIYNLPPDCVDNHYTKHVTAIVEGLYNTRDVLQKTRELTRNLEQTCNLSANVLLIIGREGEISMFNPAAEQLFGMPAASVVGHHFKNRLNASPRLVRIIAEAKEVENELVYVDKHPVLATMRCVNTDLQSQCFLSLIPVETIQGTAEKARTEMHQKGFVAKYRFENILGDSAAIRETIEIARRYSHNNAPVLICGESGTGKEMFAQAIHNHSLRADGPFVGVNFAAISESLIESELFGYEEGAFTGASKGGKQGLFRIAHKGTIFLDEIGDISTAMQSRLLRVLEEQEVMPVGSTKVYPIDVRVICATNKNLIRMIGEGKFRKDLYYRLKVLTLDVPPLRRRIEDIPVILTALTGNADFGGSLSAGLGERIGAYEWPGNIRELRALAQYLALMDCQPPESEAEKHIYERMIESFFTNWSELDGEDDVENGCDLGENDVAILFCIRDLNDRGLSAGRYSLSRHPKLSARNLSEARIKSRLNHLTAKGLIASGKTRQGVTLTPSGRRLLGSD